jgi:exonuclease III
LYQETKLQVIDLETVRQCCGKQLSKFSFALADGTRGGILIAWNPNMPALTSKFTSPWSIAIHGHLIKADTNINIISVYGPQLGSDKHAFLQTLCKRSAIDLPPATATIIAGDFNLIVQASDKNNRNLNCRSMGAFGKFINDLQLKDLYLHGRRYTWSNEQHAGTIVKLDCVMYNQEWDAAFPNCLLQAVSSEMSDHCPILLSTEANFRPILCFRFENVWVSRDDFM